MHTVDRRSAPWLLAGAIGWAGIAWIGVQLAGLSPSRAGDDLRLLLDAAGRLARSETLYQAPAAGTLAADSPFYSYPPLIAEVLQPLVRLPFALVLAGWSVLPVTWVHYPVALVPSAPAALDSRGRGGQPDMRDAPSGGCAPRRRGRGRGARRDPAGRGVGAGGGSCESAGGGPGVVRPRRVCISLLVVWINSWVILLAAIRLHRPRSESVARLPA